MGDETLVDALVRVVIVLGLLFATLRVIGHVTGRRPMRRRGRVGARVTPLRGGQDERLLEVVDRQTLGRAASVAVVRVGSRHLAIGVTEQRISLLTELYTFDDDDAADIDDPGEDLVQSHRRAEVIDLATSVRRSTSARTRVPEDTRPWRDLIEDLRQRTLR